MLLARAQRAQMRSTRVFAQRTPAYSRNVRGVSNYATQAVLSDREFRPFQLTSKSFVNHNTSVFTFKLQPETSLNIPAGKHLNVRAKIGDEFVTRPFTPITDQNTPGRIDFLIKVYNAGLMSKHIADMKLGDHLEIMGPTGTFNYQSQNYEQYGLIAGGSGITPILQVLREELRSSPNTKLSMLYANDHTEDILLKSELDTMSKENDRFNLTYVVKEGETGESYEKGFINKELIQKYMPSPSKGSKILICGPPAMETAIVQSLKELNYEPDMYFTFTQLQSNGNKDNVAKEKPTSESTPRLTMTEVAKHNKETDCWMVIDGQVYDVTKFVYEHPGGLMIMDGAGVDATQMFNQEFPHSDWARDLLPQYLLGPLEKE